MTEAKESKQYDLDDKYFWPFGFRYCLGFSASDLGFDPRLDYAQKQRTPVKTPETPRNVSIDFGDEIRYHDFMRRVLE